MQVAEPLEREAREPGAGDNQIARVEAVREQRPGPDRQQDRHRRAHRHHLLRPLVIVAQVVVEERDVVVRKPDASPKVTNDAAMIQGP